MQNVASDEEKLPGIFLEASDWQGPSVAAPASLSPELWTFGSDGEESPQSDRARAAARARERDERFSERHPRALAHPVDPWFLME